MLSFHRCIVIAQVALLVACSKGEPASELLVVVNSDLRVPDELAQIDLTVDGDVRTVTLDPSKPNAASVPLSFAISAPASDPARAIEVRALGRNADGAALVEAYARVTIPHHETRVLTLNLERACFAAYTQCGDALTCRAGACVDPTVDTNTLPRGRPDHELDGVTPLADTCQGRCFADAGYVDAAPVDAASDADAALDVPKQVCVAWPGLFDQVAKSPTKSRDDIVCPVIAYSAEWGSVDDDASVNQAAGERYADYLAGLSADIIGLSVGLQNGQLVAVAYPPPIPLRDGTLPTLASIVDRPSWTHSVQVVRLVLHETIDDYDLLASQLIAFLQSRLGAAGSATLIHPCRPIQLIADGVSTYPALVALHNKLRDTPELASIAELVQFGARYYEGGAGLIDDIAANGFRSISFERIAADAFDNIIYAEDVGLSVNLSELADPHMAANLCGASSSVEQLANAERPPPLALVDMLSQVISANNAFVDLDARRLDPAAKTLAYHGLPVPKDRTVAINDGASLPSIRPPDRSQARYASALHFEAAQRQSLTLHTADDFAVDSSMLDNPYARLNVSVVLRFARLDLQPGESQVIVSNRTGEAGWALELVNAGERTVVRFSYQAIGLTDHVPRRAVAELSVTEPGLTPGHSFYLYAHFIGTQISLQINRAGIDVDISNPPMAHAPSVSGQPVTLGADPQGTSNFFDGDILMVRVGSSRL